MIYPLFANVLRLVKATEEVRPVGTPILVPIVIIIILLLLFWWGLTRNSIPENTAVHTPDTTNELESDSDHDTHSPAAADRAVTTVSMEPDDLKKIEGIGPKIDSVLQAAGIHTFSDLAAATVTELEKIVRQDAGITIAFPDTWPEQAALARDGEWDNLAQLQDALKGGRRA